MNPEPLADASAMLMQTAQRVESLLARYFPSSGGHPYPDASGNVCLAERHGSDGQKAASAYAAAVPRLQKLARQLEGAARLETKRAQKVLARMMPHEPPLRRQDGATAACICLLLWSLHVWILELRLVMALAGDSESFVLRELDACLENLLRPGDVWLRIDIGGADGQVCVARAPAESVPVRALAWPNLLGARLACANAAVLAAQARGLRASLDEDGGWLLLGNRFAEIPPSLPPGIIGAANRAAALVGSPCLVGRGFR